MALSPEYRQEVFIEVYEIPENAGSLPASIETVIRRENVTAWPDHKRRVRAIEVRAEVPNRRFYGVRIVRVTVEVYETF